MALRFLILGVFVLSAPRLAASQEPEPEMEGEPEAEPKLGEPGFIPPNAPQCSVDWADSITDVTMIAGSIIATQSQCAMELGWTGEADCGDLRICPGHQQRTCA